jgi:hypothetical protein
MVASLLKMAGLDWSVPDYTMLCRRQKTLAVQIPYRRVDGPLNLLVDSTGIKFLGDGEWQARKHGLQVLDRLAFTPLRHRFGIDAELLAQLRERSLRSLYCSSDGVRGRGAPMTNLSHNASFHSCERIAPSNRGIKHPGSISARFFKLAEKLFL